MPKRQSKSRKKSQKKLQEKSDTEKESRNYQHQVPSAAEIMEVLTENDKPMLIDELGTQFRIKTKKHRQALEKKLNSMVRSGQILKNRSAEFCLVKRLNLITGRVSAHNDGFGFLIPDEGDTDIYLSARVMRSLFDGDRITVRPGGTDRRGRPEGQLVDILERGCTEVAGQFIRERGIALVIPDNPKVNHRILVPGKKSGGAKAGQMVVVEIVDYPTAVTQATGKVIALLGEPGERGMATELAIHAHGIPDTWAKSVLQLAESFGEQVPDKAGKDRQDLRSTALLTIDGADARDFDDAVFCEPSGTGWRLLVAIADVAHYVSAGEAIDEEAERRGTSVYFPDRVVPMLPEVLSNGLCSLNPKVDRLCLVCEMEVSAQGKVTASTFYEAVIRSAARLTYATVAEFLGEGRATGKSVSAKEIRDNLANLHDLYKAFARARTRRGALDLDIPQLRIELDAKGEVVRLRAYERNDAHNLIEECMIAANVAAARFVKKHRISALFRVHARPKADRYEEFRGYLLAIGQKVPLVEDVKPKDFTRLLAAVKDRPDSGAISMALLRSMSHAEYTPGNIGHFGLALHEYAHFTSPIRRYPDLLVHRAIKHIIAGGKPGKYRYSAESMTQLGRLTSAHERRAEDATREVEGWLKCQYMQSRVGREFDGIVSGVTAFGLFVLISELGVDGLVHVSSLRNDYYEYEPHKQCLTGSRTGKRYLLGDQLRIVVHEVDMDTRRIDFRLAMKN